MAMQHNLEKEKRLVELLGYNIVGPDGSNRWLIVDEEQNKVGYIQYKKLYNGNYKKGYAKVFGYQTFIDSPSVSCEFSRRLNDKDGNILDSTDGKYSFDIKNNSQESDHVEMYITDYPSLTVWSKEYGYINFHVDFQGLFLSFKSKTDNYNTEEVLIYNNSNDEFCINKKYIYQLKYCNKKYELNDYNPRYSTTREIIGTQKYYDKNLLKISEITWVSGKIRTERENVVEGTIEEMAVKHQMGIDCFKHFRYLINQILPFKEEVISSLINEELNNKFNLSIFFPEYSKEKSENQFKKNK